MSTKITILGSGGMATACSILLSERSDRSVVIWSRTAERADELARSRENRKLLPGVRIPETVKITDQIGSAVDAAEMLVAAIPTKYLRDTLAAIARDVPGGIPVVSVAKGLEIGTLLRPSEIILHTLGPRPIAALSGPSHAEEIARDLPASVVAASADVHFAKRVQVVFNARRFRVYTNADLVGVELAGALKNVIAIAAGICDGLGFGDNAKSALVTRGLVEMTRFGTALGARAETFSGLAGIGDLVTTCFSHYSRNRHVGERLGRGEPLEQIVAAMSGVAEGVTTTRGIHDLAGKLGVEMPITAQVHAVLFERRAPLEAATALLLRPLKDEA